jgi:hypothetical protein
MKQKIKRQLIAVAATVLTIDVSAADSPPPLFQNPLFWFGTPNPNPGPTPYPTPSNFDSLYDFAGNWQTNPSEGPEGPQGPQGPIGPIGPTGATGGQVLMLLAPAR